ncbi:myo-inositol 2-dehydrogenase [Xylariaceae sp. FL0255]|nr:myo-inositol 2-dehydrogenase [Xylariaceae sp. FL0255]
MRSDAPSVTDSGSLQTMSNTKRLGVGVIGAGEVFQICHGPCLLLMSHLFSIESICDISLTCIDHCAKKFYIPQKTTNPDDVFANSKVDVVMILASDDVHAPLAIAAIKSGKRVFIEKPLTLSLPSAQAILDAEQAAGGNRIFVGYMRRYAPSYNQAFKREIATIPKILYARVRDFSGPNANFTTQSGTFCFKPTDFPPNLGAERDARLEALFSEAFPGKTITDAHRKYCRFLGSLGSHDFSLLRESLGFPEKISSVSANEPFYTAMMDFKNKDGSPYSVTYESGIDAVPAFDAHLAVYGEKKRVTIKYSSPYVKGLPITVEVDEVNEQGETQSRTMLSSYEDTYTAELKAVYEWAISGKATKTTAEDAIQDIRIYDMIYKAWAQ